MMSVDTTNKEGNRRRKAKEEENMYNKKKKRSEKERQRLRLGLWQCSSVFGVRDLVRRRMSLVVA